MEFDLNLPQSLDFLGVQSTEFAADTEVNFGQPMPVNASAFLLQDPTPVTDISNLMASITLAMSQGPGSTSYALAQTFQPLLNVALQLQLHQAFVTTQHQGGARAHTDDAHGMIETEKQRPENIHGSEPDGRKKRVQSKKYSGPKNTQGNGARGQEANDLNTNDTRLSNRKRKPSSRYAEFVPIDG